jgi:hypothetical protein
MFDKSGALLYVGKSCRVPTRTSEHKKHSHWFNEVREIALELFDSNEAASAAEAKAIREEKPKYNIQHRAVEPQQTSKEQLTANTVGYQIRSFKPLYSVTGAAEALGVGLTTLSGLIQVGEITPIQINKRRFISGRQLIEYIENKEQQAIKRPGKKVTTGSSVGSSNKNGE